MILSDYYECKDFQTLHFSFFLLSACRPLMISLPSSATIHIHQHLHGIESFAQLVMVILYELHLPLNFVYAHQLFGLLFLTGMRTILQVHEIIQDGSTENASMIHFLLLDNLVIFLFLLVPFLRKRT